MSVKYLVGHGNTFFITMSLKTSSLAPHTVTFIPCETWEWTTFGVFSGMSTSGQYVRGKNQNTYMLREARSGKKHAGGILRPSYSPQCMCATKR